VDVVIVGQRSTTSVTVQRLLQIQIRCWTGKVSRDY